MNGLIAFTKKEFLEQIRSYKAVIMVSVLFLFGMMSPLLAKMMPDIFAQLTVQGISISMPEPTVLDAYGQFFKNMSQMGLIILLLVFNVILSQEVTRGTLVILLAKGLSRSAVIMSKYLASLFLWTVSYVLAAITDYGYTVYLFGSFSLPHLFFSLFCLWLFGAFLLAVLLLASTLASGNYGGLLLTAAIMMLLLIANVFPVFQKWNPVALASDNITLLTDAETIGDMSVTAWTALLLIVLCLILSLLVFKKKKL
ncbi:ABC transporter permease [Dehalobacter sp. TBBPA1]|uniref:ABC transporter permease n=1 Tax=Dehalobacter sp. TBBPA1 TaxID=3235037 RepID=UPI0034A29CEE